MISVYDLKPGQICLWECEDSKEVYLILDIDINTKRDIVKCLILESTGYVKKFVKTNIPFDNFGGQIRILSDKEELPYRKIITFQ